MVAGSGLPAAGRRQAGELADVDADAGLDVEPVAAVAVDDGRRTFKAVPDQLVGLVDQAVERLAGQRRVALRPERAEQGVSRGRVVRAQREVRQQRLDPGAHADGGRLPAHEHLEVAQQADQDRMFAPWAGL